jgi:hypothetical protein
MAAFRFHMTRMHTLPLEPDKKQKEKKTIKLIAENNNFPQHLLQKLIQQIQHKASHQQTGKKDHTIWTTFTYQSEDKENYQSV